MEKKYKQTPSNYTKIGRISMSVAKSAGIMSADIIIDTNHLVHIRRNHKRELANLGITALDFLKLVTSSYNRIYKDKKTNAIYLTIYNSKPTANSILIEANYNEKTKWWEIKTATPMRVAFFKSKDLLYQKSAPRL